MRRALTALLLAACGSSPSPPPASPAPAAPRSDDSSLGVECQAGALMLSQRGETERASGTPFFLTDDFGVVASVTCNGDDVAITRYKLEPAGADGKQELECAGGARFLLSTETGAGSCSRSLDAAGGVVGGSCRDQGGNLAEVICQLEGGRGACSRTVKAGACRPSIATPPG